MTEKPIIVKVVNNRLDFFLFILILFYYYYFLGFPYLLLRLLYLSLRLLCFFLSNLISLVRRSTRPMNNSINLSIISTDYCEFTNIFSKAKTKVFVSHFYNFLIKKKVGLLCF